MTKSCETCEHEQDDCTNRGPVPGCWGSRCDVTREEFSALEKRVTELERRALPTGPVGWRVSG